MGDWEHTCHDASNCVLGSCIEDLTYLSSKVIIRKIHNWTRKDPTALYDLNYRHKPSTESTDNGRLDRFAGEGHEELYVSKLESIWNESVLFKSVQLRSMARRCWIANASSAWLWAGISWAWLGAYKLSYGASWMLLGVLALLGQLSTRVVENRSLSWPWRRCNDNQVPLDLRERLRLIFLLC